MGALEFLGRLFNSFFRWWWAVITGIASLLGAISLEGTIGIGKTGVALLILVSSLLLFLTVSAVYQSFRFLRGENARVINIVESDAYGGDYVFAIDGLDSSFRGKVVELRRDTGDVEVTFALVELVETNIAGTFQAKPIWLSSGHQYDLKRKKFSKNDVRVQTNVNSETLEKWTAENR